MNNKSQGHLGEQDVIKLIPCPNCGKKLMQLPINYPLYDLQCTGCSFRAQVKTNNSKPKKEVFGAGWEIMDKVTKSGYLIPPLIVYYKWVENGRSHRKIIFFPFVPKVNLKRRTLSSKARRANYMMFNYVKLDVLPHFVLFEY